MGDNTCQEIKEPYGFGGWFAIILIGLFGNIILGIIELANYSEIWVYVDFGLGTLLAISCFNSIFFSVIILISIFRKDIRFRIMYLIQTCISVIMAFILLGIVRIDGQMIGSMIGRILWTIYLYKSVRVQNTFDYR